MTVSNGPMSEPSGVALATDLVAMQKAMKSPPEIGEVWYLVNTDWFDKYKEYLAAGRNPDKHPGPIDHGDLLNPDGEVKANVTEDLDFYFLPANVWNSLVETVGLKVGQTPLGRKVIQMGLYTKTCVIEIYPPRVEVALASDPDKRKSITVSRGTKLEELRDRILDVFGLDRQESRLYQELPDAPPDTPYERLTSLLNNLYDLSVTDGRLFLVDVKNPDWTIKLPEETAPKPMETAAGYSGMATRSSVNQANKNGDDGVYGLCGLTNLGNTCFMNSGLQCMSNCPPLTEYFQSGLYEDEINEANPLGTGGEMAKAYASLIKEMWSGQHSSVVPRHMKQTIGRFKETFLGYQQQDSQELIAFLLDGLHEDLNRVRMKPYVAANDNDSRPDHEIANESWKNYRLRNDSIIVDLFHGQIKSTVVCPECDKVSVTFDPSCYLSVPLPQRRDRVVPLTLLYRNASRPPTQFKVMVPKVGTMVDLAEGLSKLSGVPVKNLVFYDVYSYKVFKIFETTSSLVDIGERDDIFAAELEHPVDADVRLIQVCHRTKGDRYMSSMNGFGTPLVISVPKREMSYDELHGTVQSAIQRWLDQPGDNWWKGSDSGLDDNGEDSTELTRLPYSLSLVASLTSSTVKELKPDDVYPADLELNFLAVEWSSRGKKFYRADLPAVVDPSALKDRPKGCGLLDCFDLYTTKEQLGQDDAWFCPRCKKHQMASKTLELWRLPKVLIVQLKRFQYTRWHRDKIETLVDFPLTGLDVTKFIASGDKGQHVYDLFAVSNHMGGLGGGHYTAFAKNVTDGRWHEFDDSRVNLIKDERAVVTKYGYVLFYLRREDEDVDVEMKDV